MKGKLDGLGGLEGRKEGRKYFLCGGLLVVGGWAGLGWRKGNGKVSK